uniref:Uncharacterized protein n=1 Tax=uncultured marine virus TaxID=186617 RepID=A0A0F7L649_9VIRU|nr:hypothetical protein [uncultured marine virus]
MLCYHYTISRYTPPIDGVGELSKSRIRIRCRIHRHVFHNEVLFHFPNYR